MSEVDQAAILDGEVKFEIQAVRTSLMHVESKATEEEKLKAVDAAEELLRGIEVTFNRFRAEVDELDDISRQESYERKIETYMRTIVELGKEVRNKRRNVENAADGNAAASSSPADGEAVGRSPTSRANKGGTSSPETVGLIGRSHHPELRNDPSRFDPSRFDPPPPNAVRQGSAIISILAGDKIFICVGILIIVVVIALVIMMK